MRGPLPSNFRRKGLAGVQVCDEALLPSANRHSTLPLWGNEPNHCQEKLRYSEASFIPRVHLLRGSPHERLCRYIYIAGSVSLSEKQSVDQSTAEKQGSISISQLSLFYEKRKEAL